jgi:oligopeptide/dipeptide ABC transporter ATP-binding protein
MSTDGGSILLDVRDLSVKFKTRDGLVNAVSDLSFTLRRGETLGVVGESGSGKSVTSLAIMGLLNRAYADVSGEILFEGKDLLTLPKDELRKIRGRDVSMIFQDPFACLHPMYRVGDQIAEAVLAHSGNGNGRVTKSEAWTRAVEALRTVAIAEPDRRARSYPHQLSGGQRQRVMIAMAVVNRPSLLIADEPTTALDVTIQAQVLDLLAELREKFSLAMLFISHDLAVVSQISSRIGVMYAGSVVEMGMASDVFHDPRHPYTRGLLNSVPTLRSDRAKPLQTIDGTVPAVSAKPAGCAFEPRCAISEAACGASLPPLVELAPEHFARCPVTAREVR